MGDGRADVLVGGQFGSEGKGGILAKLLADDPTRWVAHVRVGASNAGHTGYGPDGVARVALQLPLACHLVGAPGIIGAGALISKDIMERELAEIRARGLSPNIYVDERAHIIMDWHKETEAKAGLEKAIGSTSTIAKEGIGAAELARVARLAMYGIPAGSHREWFKQLGIAVTDTAEMLERIMAQDKNVLLEGTQGFGLSLIHGFWPYVTSRDTSTSGILSQIGVSPRRLGDVIGVFRTYPIRVHGNSGPWWWDQTEATWEQIGVPEEKTTVTKRVRRVATWSQEGALKAIDVCGINKIALTFWDYIDAGADEELAPWNRQPWERPSLGYAEQYIPQNTRGASMIYALNAIQNLTGAKLSWLATGPRPENVHDVVLEKTETGVVRIVPRRNW